MPPSLGPNLGYEATFGDFTDTFSLIVPGPPVVNQQGAVAFRAVARPTGQLSQRGIWTNHGGNLHPAAFGGSEELGPNLGVGVFFAGFWDPLINAPGEVVFVANTFGPNVVSFNQDGVWSIDSTRVTPIASREPAAQNPLPGLAAQTRYLIGLSQNDVGAVAFGGSLAGDGVTTDNDWAVFANSGGALEIVAREGSDAPGLGTGVEFSDFDVFAIPGATALNRTGTVLFNGPLRGAGIDLTNNRALWLSRSGTPELIARSGPAGPGPNLGGGLVFSSFRDFTLNSQDEFAFLAILDGPGVNLSNRWGIWSNLTGTLQALVRTGDPGISANLDPATKFIEVGAPALNAKGEVAFRGVATGPGIDGGFGEGIWTCADGVTRAVALGRSNVPALSPGLGGGITFFSVSDPAMNASGDLVFQATLTGSGITGANDQSLWLWSRGQLTMLLREGDFYDLDPDPLVENLQQIDGFSVATGSGGEDGRQLGLNDRGQFAAVVSFTSGRSAIVLGCIVPEPSIGWMLIWTLLAMAITCGRSG